MLNLSISWSGIDKAIDALVRYEAEQRARLRLACLEAAQLLERYAITNHPWTVRTQATNVTTRGTWVELADDMYEVVLSAGMDYDVFLEGYRADGSARAPEFQKWAWLWPALTANAEEVKSIFARHLAN